MNTEPLPPSPWRTWRQRRGWSQKYAADRSGVREATISDIERGKNATLDTMQKLIAAYGVSAEEAGVVLVGGGS